MRVTLMPNFNYYVDRFVWRIKNGKLDKSGKVFYRPIAHKNTNLLWFFLHVSSPQLCREPDKKYPDPLCLNNINTNRTCDETCLALLMSVSFPMHGFRSLREWISLMLMNFRMDFIRSSHSFIIIKFVNIASVSRYIRSFWLGNKLY